jgi:tetratricopeptide (TPR) repeat protein
MIGALRKANVLVRDEGAWVLANDADLSTVSLGIPDSVHGIILARLDRLPDSHKPTIKVASVIGYSFELGLVAQVHPSRPNENMLRDQANTLEERDFILGNRQSGPEPTPNSYIFRQQATQEVSYETLLFTQRRELHCNIAEHLERETPKAIDQIAYHAYLGEDWARSLRYHLAAGFQDKHLFANLQSIEHFRLASVSADHLPEEETLAERKDIHAGLGELLLTIGQHDEALEHLQEALALADKLGDPEAQAHVCRWLARSYEVRGQYEPALEWIGRGLSFLGDSLSPSALELRLIGGLIFSRLGDYERARRQARACLLAAEELQQPSIVARSHNLLGIIERSRGRIRESAFHIEESLRLYEEIGNLQGQALAQNSLANAYFDMGQWTEADRFYRLAGQKLTQLGNVYNKIFIDNNLGGIALNQGRLDDARLYYQQALHSMKLLGGSLWLKGVIHLNLGATHTRRDELPVAFEHLNKSRELFEQVKNRDLLPEMHRRFSEAYLAGRELAHAREEGLTALSLAEELSMLGEQGLARQVIGKIDAAEGRFDEAEENFLKAIDLLQKVGDDYGLARAQLSLAQLYDSYRQYDRRDEFLRQCDPIFRRLGASIEESRVQSLLNASLARNGTQKRGYPGNPSS